MMRRKHIGAIVLTVLPAVILVSAISYFAGTHANAEKPKYYLVEAGDTCSKISFEHNIPLDALIRQNDLPPDCSPLFEGQLLTIRK
jgi:LysM repeat protein